MFLGFLFGTDMAIVFYVSVCQWCSYSSLLLSWKHHPSDAMCIYLQAPLANVSMAVSLSNASRATVTPQQLLFTPNNWSLPQLVRAISCLAAFVMQ